MLARWARVSAMVLSACGGAEVAGGDGGPGRDAGGGATVDASAPFDIGEPPDGRIWPVAGELFVIQMDLPVGLTGIGEAAIAVGPDGTLALIDSGNGGHADEIVELVEELNGSWLTPERGYPRTRSAHEVDWIVLTHYHADHIGGAAEMLDALEVTGGLVHRGPVDLGEGANLEEWARLCEAAAGGRAIELCRAAERPACGEATGFPATGCDGLALGDLTAGDDDGEAAAFAPLGDGARLAFLLADAHAIGGAGEVVAAAAFPSDASNQENARSLAGLIEHGEFRYLFAGDLTGSGEEEEPDIESHLVAVAGSTLAPCGADVVHASHHARRTSSSAGFADWAAPRDGRARNVVAGINEAYVGSPHEEVVERWTEGGRLGAGSFYATHVAAGGAGGAVVDADGPVILRTAGGGQGYWMQAAGQSPTIAGFVSVRRDGCRMTR